MHHSSRHNSVPSARQAPLRVLLLCYSTPTTARICTAADKVSIALQDLERLRRAASAIEKVLTSCSRPECGPALLRRRIFNGNLWLCVLGCVVGVAWLRPRFMDLVSLVWLACPVAKSTVRPSAVRRDFGRFPDLNYILLRLTIFACLGSVVALLLVAVPGICKGQE